VSSTEATARAASLADAVLEAEAERQAAQAEKEVLFADDLLPGVGGEELTLRGGLAVGGTFTFLMLLLLNAAEGLETATLSVLAPDMRDSFGVSSGVIVFISAAAGGFLVLGALPMGWLADRYRRSPIVAASSALFAVMVFLSGLAVNAFTLFLARFGVGIAKSATIPVHSSLIADAYPIGVRGRLNATTMGSNLLVASVSPAIVGAIASLAGGDDGWRWAFFLLGLPVLALAVFALRIPEPPRGQFEMRDVLGEVIDIRPVPTSVEAAFARLKQVRTLRTAMAAFAALGFGLFTGPVLQGLYLEDRFELDAFERGLLGSLGGLCVLGVLPFAARRYDRLFREDPAKACASSAC
jgi:MFS family permease